MAAQDALIDLLRARPNLPAAQVRDALGVSPATLMRWVRAAGADVLTLGQARRTAYAARRALRGSRAALPVFQIDARGGYGELGSLDLAYPEGCVLRLGIPCSWPLDDPMRDGWFEGVPYFMQDLRPEGFLGRQFARAHARVLQLGEDPRAWSDDDVLHALSLLGADQTGNLVVGEPALQLWLEQVQRAPEPIAQADVANVYAERARLAMSQGVAGSSAPAAGGSRVLAAGRAGRGTVLDPRGAGRQDQRAIPGGLRGQFARSSEPDGAVHKLRGCAHAPSQPCCIRGRPRFGRCRTS